MARKSRNHLLLPPGAVSKLASVEPVQPKYRVALYARLSVEDNNIVDGCSTPLT